MHFSEGKVMVTSCQKRSADQAPNGINGGGVAGPFMPAWCLICAALLACLSPTPPTKSLDLSLTLTNNVIHVNDVPEHLLTMYPVCTLERIPTGAGGAARCYHFCIPTIQLQPETSSFLRSSLSRSKACGVAFSALNRSISLSRNTFTCANP